MNDSFATSTALHFDLIMENTITNVMEFLARASHITITLERERDNFIVEFEGALGVFDD